MADILMINLPFAGHTNPTLPLARMLIQRGHEVSYINAEEFRKKTELTGAEFIPYENYPESPTMRQKKSLCFRAAFDTAVHLKKHFDLLIYEMLFYPGFRIAEILNIPCVRQFSQPAWNAHTISSASLGFKLSSALIDAQLMGKKNSAYMGLGNKTLHEAVLNDRPLLNVVYVPRMFQAASETFDENYLFTVPISISGEFSQAIPYEKMKPPVVYISLGSIISSKGFYKKCIRAFGGKNLSVILNTGKISPEALGKIPDNIYAYSFVPQIEVLHESDVFVTHCGMNSVNEALSLGVPMVAVPFINDQLSNAKRIEELGIGKKISAFQLSEKALYQTVENVYNSAHIRARSTELQKSVESEVSLEDVALRIEKIF